MFILKEGQEVLRRDIDFLLRYVVLWPCLHDPSHLSLAKSALSKYGWSENYNIKIDFLFFGDFFWVRSTF